MDQSETNVPEGAVGVEMATSLKSRFPEQDVTLIHSRKELLGSEPLPDDFKRKVHDRVLEKGVKLILNNRVTSQNSDTNNGTGATGYRLTLSNGNVLRYDMVLDTTGFKKAATPTGTNSLLGVNGVLAVHPT
jgi:pyruvate/2-oxoglutarate dehydrogenase complex dihydrolipoamide dehydrogenase (E3) component